MARNILVDVAVLILQHYACTHHEAILTWREMQIYEKLYINTPCGWFFSFAFEIPATKPNLLIRIYRRIFYGKS